MTRMNDNLHRHKSLRCFLVCQQVLALFCCHLQQWVVQRWGWLDQSVSGCWWWCETWGAKAVKETSNTKQVVPLWNDGRASKPFDAVHNPDQSEDPQDQDNVQDLTAAVDPRYDITQFIMIVLMLDLVSVLSCPSRTSVCRMETMCYLISAVSSFQMFKFDFLGTTWAGHVAKNYFD